MGTFNPDTFLDINVTEANSIESTPVPEGEYLAMAGEPKIRQWNSKDGTKSGLALDIPWTIDSPSPKEYTGRDTNVVMQGLMLDLNEGGGLDTGKGMNVGLGRLREAVGLNTPGKPFNFRQIQGQLAKITIKHRLVEDARFADVKGVTKA